MSARSFRMPAEWEPHEATWIAWPHHAADWPGKFLTIPLLYGEFVRRLARVEPVRVLVRGLEMEQDARRKLRKAGVNLASVEFFHCHANRSWTRDYCPLFVKDGEGRKISLNWQFNGWGKYDDWPAEDAIPECVAKWTGMEECKPSLGGRRIVLEGGSVDVNGKGAMLATEECLLSPVQARNPGLSREDLERTFSDYLGVRKVLWLKNGIAGDETHGHVDNLARFINPATVAIATEGNAAEVNYWPLKENLELLRRMTDQDGAPLRIVTLPLPEPVYFDGQRLPASYANFYIANGLVLVPTFNDPNDRIALNTLAEAFPDRQVVGMACTDLVLGLGTLHCMTQQQPV